MHRIRNLAALLMLISVSIGLVGCNGSAGTDSNDVASVITDVVVDGEVITSTSPSTQSIGIAINTNVVVAFSTAIDSGSLNDQNYYLVGAGGSPVVSSIRYENNQAILDPLAELDPGTTYTAVIENILQPDGQAVPSQTWTFTTASGALPPEFSAWIDNMQTYGRQWGDIVTDPNNTWENRFFHSYYDAQWVFYQIADYTNEAEPWLRYAEDAKANYRDNYYRPADYREAGYQRFPHGIFEHYMRGGDSTIDDVRKIRDNPAFSNPEIAGEVNEWYHQGLAREVAYAIHSHITAEKAGEPRNDERMGLYMAMVQNHLNQWQTNDYSSPVTNNDLDIFQPFMFALEAHALIDFYEWEVANGRNPDVYFPDIPGRLANFASWLFNEARVQAGDHAGERLWCATAEVYPSQVCGTDASNGGAFRYVDRPYTLWDELNTPYFAHDLNLLMAPAYAWLYKQTGDVAFKQQGDQIFAGGVKTAGLGYSGKIFFQNYRWSFAFIKWREEGDLLHQ